MVHVERKHGQGNISDVTRTHHTTPLKVHAKTNCEIVIPAKVGIPVTDMFSPSAFTLNTVTIHGIPLRNRHPTD